MDLRTYSDPLADLTDQQLAELREYKAPSLYPIEAHAQNPANRFLYDIYDWSDFKAEGQVTLRLTQGYFTFIGEEDADRLEGREVCISRKVCPTTGESIGVRAVLRHNGNAVPLHRFLTNARHGAVVDHINNLALDNRRLKNLWCTSWSLNNSNRFFGRKAHNGLLRGVYRHDDKFCAQIQYKDKKYHSPVCATQQEAHDWYLAKQKEFYGDDLGPQKRPERSYPMFPPLKKAAIPSLAAIPVGTVIQAGEIPF